MNSSYEPNPLWDKLLDHLHGEAAPAEGATPEGTAAQAALARLLAAESRAHEVPLDPAAPARCAARVRDRVRTEEERAARQSRSRPVLVRWAWVLGSAVAAHLLVLGVLGARRVAHGPPDGAGLPSDLPGTWAVRPAEPAELDGAGEGLGAGALAPYALDGDQLALERAKVLPSVGAEAWPQEAGLALHGFAPGAARAMALRSSDPAKRWIEARVGTSGSLAVAQRSLAALAAQQAADGSFPAATGSSAEATTGLVLLAFLGDGHSSAAGAHRQVVSRGLDWLRRRTARDPAAAGAFGLWAFAEDFLLANGSLTPAESARREGELARWRDAVREAGSAAGPPEAWRSALAATARAGLATGAGFTALPVTAQVSVGVALDPAADAWVGSAMLHEGRAEEFRAWASQLTPRLRARLAEDGLLRVTALDPRGGTEPGDRIAQTALLVLALQVPYRTL